VAASWIRVRPAPSEAPPEDTACYIGGGAPPSPGAGMPVGGLCLRLPSAMLRRAPPSVGDVSPLEDSDAFEYHPGPRVPPPRTASGTGATDSPIRGPPMLPISPGGGVGVGSGAGGGTKKPAPLLPIRAAGSPVETDRLRMPSGIIMRRPMPSQGDCEDMCVEDSVFSAEARPRAGSSNVNISRSKFLLEHSHSAQLADLYDMEKEALGVGGFGTVRKARLKGSTSDVYRAVKSVKIKSAAAERGVRHEVAVLRRLDHPHICRLLEAFHTTGVSYLVMEYVDGRELFDFIQETYAAASSADEGIGACIFQQLFGALEYCHGHRVVHRDLKPENVMIQNSPAGSPKSKVEIRLIDFGLAVLYKHTGRPSLKAAAGTYAYMAPEVRSGIDVTPASDLWSAGVVLHTLLLGGLPLEEVRMGSEPLDLSQEDYQIVSDPAKEILAGLLRTDAKSRLTAEQALRCRWCVEKYGHKVVPKEHVKNLMGSFSNFHKGSILQRAMLTALAMQLATERIEDLREQFFACDKDHNGRISRQELSASFENSGGGAVHLGSWVDSVFESLDTDGSQELEYTEWLAAAVKDGEAKTESALLAAFRSCDADGSGKISQREVMRLLAATPTAAIAGAMKEFDLDGDGELNFEEFITLIKKSLPSASDLAAT